jgi:hypothetical protein
LVQVHAADALVALKELEPVRTVYEAQLPIDPTSPFRVGAWRSLAGAARNPAERAQWIDKIEREFLDLNGTLRVGAIESLCKLGHAVSGEVREAARVMAANGPEADGIFACWALYLAGDHAALPQILRALTSESPPARLRAGYALRWLRVNDATTLGKLAAAADAEPAGTIARPYLVSAALSLEADRSRLDAWRREADRTVAEGAPGARYEFCQTLMRRIQPRDLPRYVPLVTDNEGDVRIAAAWLILHVLGQPKR